MNNSFGNRISGTYWERLLLVALPIPLIAGAAIVLKNDPFPGISVEALFIVAVIVLMVWLVDSEPARRWNPVSLVSGQYLEIGPDIVQAIDIVSITPLRRYRPPTTALIEIVFHTPTGQKTACVLSKPDVAPIGFFTRSPKTLRLLLAHHPELRNRVQPERII
jgi:hypothetical protein